MLPTRPNQINPSVEFSYKEEYTIKLILTKQEAVFYFIFFYQQTGERKEILHKNTSQFHTKFLVRGTNYYCINFIVQTFFHVLVICIC